MSQQSLHPPRLAGTFVSTPSAPGTPVHSIQTIRRKAAGHHGPLTKILVANRGVCASLDCPSGAMLIAGQEIAIRVFRTAHELAMHTVAIFSFEDRMSAHRQKVASYHCVQTISNILNARPMKLIKLERA